VRRAAAAVTAAVVLAGCGGEAGDLLAVERSGSIPRARLQLRFTVDGRVSCNRGALRELHSDQVIDARAIESELAGEEGKAGTRGAPRPPACPTRLGAALPGPRGGGRGDVRRHLAAPASGLLRDPEADARRRPLRLPAAAVTGLPAGHPTI
jgi:hypothetical protein